MKDLTQVEIFAKENGFGTWRNRVALHTVHSIGKLVNAAFGVSIEVNAVFASKAEAVFFFLLVEGAVKGNFHGLSLQQDCRLHVGGLGKHIEPRNLCKIVPRLS